ncbi:MAG: hypothetical protein C5B51_23485 [Terriglobia bacterium]|nr:MAG: hypothetical protein C5B51_23485 [Terriglobia bacterium]
MRLYTNSLSIEFAAALLARPMKDSDDLFQAKGLFVRQPAMVSPGKSESLRLVRASAAWGMTQEWDADHLPVWATPAYSADWQASAAWGTKAARDTADLGY